MRKITTLVLTLVTVVLLISSTTILAGGSCGASKTTSAEKISTKASGQIVTLNVSNMTCGGCVNQVTKSLATIEGVNDVQVSLEDGTAVVTYNAAKIETKALTAAIVKAGFPAKIVESANVTSAKKLVGCDPKACGTNKKGCNPKACGMKKTSTPETTKDGKDNN